MGDYHPAAITKHKAPGSPAAPKPKFIITGFGRFCGVAKNPTEQLVNWLQQRTCHTKAVATAETQQDPAISTAPGEEQAHYCVSSLDVLEVSADAVDQFMEQQQQKLLQQAADSSKGPQPVVLLHFGVDTQRPAISLELQAYNNATFNCPDQTGWQPKACLIEGAPGLGTSSVRTTTLPLQELVQQLRDSGFECSVSRDAGRFVCNYTYYKSLQLSSKLQQQLVWHQQQQQAPGTTTGAQTSSSTDHSTGHSNGNAQPSAAGSGVRAGSSPGEHGWPVFSLFVHMPSFEVVNQARQREFALLLLDLVASWVAGGSQQTPVQ